MQPNGDHLARSGIPLPSTVKKPTPASRFRQSFAVPPPPLGSGPRHSLYPTQSQKSNPLLLSASKPGAAFGRTPLRNSVRGTSQWTGGRQSMAPQPLPLSQPKDQRALRDKTVQANMRNAIYNWLMETEFNGPISKQTLMSITARDFRGIVEHLIVLLDPRYEFGQRGIKFDDEFLFLLRMHRYPYVDSIDKKGLATPASMHAWPALLGALHWLVDMSKARLSYLESNDPDVCADDAADPFASPQHESTLTLRYLTETYGIFLGGVDDFPVQERSMEEIYAKKDEHVVVELDAERAEYEALLEQFNRMKATPSLRPQLESDSKFLKSDKRKFQEYLAHCEKSKKKYTDAIEAAKIEIGTLNTNLQNLRQEQERLALAVKEQNLSQEEVAKMNNDHSSLGRQLEELKKKLKETGDTMRSLEVAWAKRTESVEQSIDTYNASLAELGLIPVVPPPLPQVDLRLESNFPAASPKDLVCRTADGMCADLKGDIKQALDGIAGMKRVQRRQMEDQAVNVEQEIDSLTTECEKMEEEIVALESRIAVLLNQAQDVRDAIQHETLVTNREASRLERDLAQARTAALANGVGVKSRLQALQIAYQEQIERTDRLKDETVRAIVKSSSDIAQFKEEVSRHLNHLRQFAEEN